MKLIQVLGPGCTKCETLKKNAEQAVKQAGVEATVENFNAVLRFVSRDLSDGASAEVRAKRPQKERMLSGEKGVAFDYRRKAWLAKATRASSETTPRRKKVIAKVKSFSARGADTKKLDEQRLAVVAAARDLRASFDAACGMD